MLNHRG
jgi:hypothetical protein